MKQAKYSVLLLSAIFLFGTAARSFGYGYGRSAAPAHPFGKAYSEVPVYRGIPNGGSAPLYRENPARRGTAAAQTAVSGSPAAPVYYEIGTPVSLFNGTDLTGWTNAGGEAPNPGWQVQDGAIYRAGEGAGSLFSQDEFDNFILEFDFKAARGSNSGVKYRLWDQDGDIRGCEYQILDPEGSDRGDLHDTAALYDVFPAAGVREFFNKEEYNHAKIVVKGDHIEHWLNGRRIVSVLVNSDQWRENLAKSKFAGSPFGQNARSRIFLQDHGDPVWFKNITVTPLIPLG